MENTKIITIALELLKLDSKKFNLKRIFEMGNMVSVYSKDKSEYLTVTTNGKVIQYGTVNSQGGANEIIEEKVL